MSRSCTHRAARLLAVIALLAVLAIPCAGQKPGAIDPAVVPPNARVGGLTMGDWGARWWSWIAQTPLHNAAGDVQHPLLDATGQYAGVGQSGEVFFLAGSWIGQVERHVTIPPGKKLYFPLLNWCYFTFPTDPLPWFTEPELIAMQSPPAVGNLHTIWAVLDGKPIQNLDRTFAVSGLFRVAPVPEDNVFGLDLVWLEPTQSFEQSLCTGYALMLEPLTPGVHTLTFGATTVNPANPDEVWGWQDIAYQITVAPRGK